MVLFIFFLKKIKKRLDEGRIGCYTCQAAFEKDKTTTTEYVMERYRSGHNEAVLKTVCPQGRVGSNPTLSVIIARNHF